MSVEKFNRNFEDLFNWDTSEQPTTEQEYQNAVKNWTQTEMNLVDTVLWQPETAYSVGNIAKTPSLPSQYILVCTEAGDSGVAEPDYTGVSVGDTVVDGTVTWLVSTIANGGNIDALTTAVEANTQAIGEHSTAIAENTANVATNTENIATNAENIATNASDIATNATDIDIAEKRISNIEKLLQGNLYDYQTDSTSAYTKTVPSGAMPYAGLEQIGGKTLVMNQLFSVNDKTSTSNGMTFEFSNNVCTYNGKLTGFSTAYIELVARTSGFIAGHKYYYVLKVNPTQGDDAPFYAAISMGGYWERSANSPRIYTADSSSYIRVRFRSNQTIVDQDMQRSGTMVSQLFDLTLMFGAGNEPSTVAEFEAMFPASYYPYNAGTLLSAGVTEVVSNSTNIFDYDTYKSLMQSLSYPVTRGTVAFSGNGLTVTATSNDAFTTYGGVLRIPIKPSVKYTLSVTVNKGGGSFWLFAYNSAGASTTKNHYNFASAGRYSTTITSTSATALLSYRFGVDTSGNSITFSDIQLEESETATEYKPYAFPSLPIPAEIQALEGYGWSAGTAYNYVDFERKVFVKRVERVDLGNFTYLVSADYFGAPAFYSQGTFPQYKSTATNIVGNFVNERYVSASILSLQENPTTPVMALYTNGSINIRDSKFSASQTADLKASLRGVYLYYELAIPQETDISEYLTDNLIEVGAGGTLTFPNSNGDDYHIPVPSTETYMIDLQEAISNG